MNKSSLMSIIIPAFNAEKYIGRCLESIKEQTYTEWEAIVIDDCSKDNTIELVAEYAKKDSRIKLIRQSVNQGPMMARRIGDFTSQGRYIIYCDADDTLPANALEIYDGVISGTDVDIVCGNYNCIDKEGNIKEKINKLPRYCDNNFFLKAVLNRSVNQSLCVKAFRASIVKNASYKVYEHMTNGEDVFLLYQMMPYVKHVVYTNNNMYNYYEITGSSTHKRLSVNGLESICRLNQLRSEMTKQFPSLKKAFIRTIQQSLCLLYNQKYDENKVLSSLVHQYNLQQYCTLSSLIKHNGLVNAIIMLLKMRPIS